MRDDDAGDALAADGAWNHPERTIVCRPDTFEFPVRNIEWYGQQSCPVSFKRFCFVSSRSPWSCVCSRRASFGVGRFEATHPPTGQFVEVQGVRLHVAVLGLGRNTPGAEPAVVLIHGASGNLEDMRLALGEARRVASRHPD